MLLDYSIPFRLIKRLAGAEPRAGCQFRQNNDIRLGEIRVLDERFPGKLEAIAVVR
jgi:hypothetical protein